MSSRNQMRFGWAFHKGGRYIADTNSFHHAIKLTQNEFILCYAE